MRLIDADKVIQSVDRQISIARELLSNDPQYQEFISITEQCFKQEISNAPTVKAIPIKWLKQWFERQAWQGSSPTDRIHCKASDIIEDWEKENESRKGEEVK